MYKYEEIILERVKAILLPLMHFDKLHVLQVTGARLTTRWQ